MIRVKIRFVVAAAVACAISACNGERTQLANDLKSDKAGVRAAAVHRLAELKSSQDLPIFLARTQDRDPLVRRTAAEALGALGDPRGIDPLGVLLADPDEDVQIAAAQALATLGDEKARAYLMIAFDRRGTATRSAIAAAVGPGALLQEAIRKEANTIWEHTSKTLESGRPAERVGAAEELGRSGRADAVDRLIPLLGNDAILLAAGAARGLGAAGDIKAVPALMAVLKENDPQLREAAAQALGQLGDPSALGVLTQLAQGGDQAALEATEALTRLPPSAEVQAALCSVASSAGAPNGATLAARSASQRGGCKTEPLLSRLAKGGSEARAALAALSVLGAGKEEVAVKVVPLMDDKDPGIRSAALRVLGATGSPAASAALTRWVKAETERLRLAREKWVKVPFSPSFESGFSPPPQGSRSDYRKKFDTLIDKVHQNNEAQAAASGQPLKVPRRAPAQEVLPDVAPDDGQLLGQLASALGQTRGQGAEELLLPLADDPIDEVRLGALVGLAYLGTEASMKKVADAWPDVPDELVGTLSEALQSVGKSAGPTLVEGLTARDSARPPIALALGAIGDVDAAAPLEKLLEQGGEDSVAAAVSLGRLGQSRSVKPLVQLLRDSQAPASREAVHALGLLRDPTVQKALVRQLFSDRWESALRRSERSRRWAWRHQPASSMPSGRTTTSKSAGRWIPHWE